MVLGSFRVDFHGFSKIFGRLAGHFSVDADHAAVGKMLRGLVEMKLRHFLEQGEMDKRLGGDKLAGGA